MEWKVGNALSRDVERQHLNKILAEIRTTVSNLTSSSSQKPVTNTINTVTRYAVARFTITLSGAVTGSAEVDGTDDVTIETRLNTDDLNFVEEAPTDNQYYSRWNGEWKVHSAGLSTPEGVGILVQIENADYEKETIVREIEVETGELTVADGDGQAGNPTLGLADTAVTPGSYLVANITVDQKGRLTAADDGTPVVMARISLGF